MGKIKFKISTPERVVLEDEVDQVTLPTRTGEITVLPGHIALLTVIAPGVIETKNDNQETAMAVSGGFLEFHDNQMVILADTAERAEEIDLERAEQARKRAEQMRQEARKGYDEEQFAQVISIVEKQLARIRAAKKYNPRSKKSTTLDD